MSVTVNNVFVKAMCENKMLKILYEVSLGQLQKQQHGNMSDTDKKLHRSPSVLWSFRES